MICSIRTHINTAAASYGTLENTATCRRRSSSGSSLTDQLLQQQFTQMRRRRPLHQGCCSCADVWQLASGRPLPASADPSPSVPALWRRPAAGRVRTYVPRSVVWSMAVYEQPAAPAELTLWSLDSTGRRRPPSDC